MSKDELTIIAADYMYLIILSDEFTIKKIVNKLNSNNNEKNKNFYIMNDIDKPCAEILDDEYIKKIIIDEAKKHKNYNFIEQ
jgi:hypothetical protein